MKFLKLSLLLFACTLNGNTSNSLPNASYLGHSNWYESSWFGVFFETQNSWVYHNNLEWLFLHPSDSKSFWMYSPSLRWMWINEDYYPWIYLNQTSKWTYYSPLAGFFDPDSKEWATKTDLSAQIISIESDKYTSEHYKSGKLIPNNTISSWFDRSLEINGVQLLVAAAIGGQVEVPAEWAKKVAQVVKLLTDPNAEGINISSQERMIQVLKGATGTWHQGYPTAQRVAYGGGSDYSPNPLTDEGITAYSGYQNLDNFMMNDMVWYRNSSDGEINNVGDYDIAEVLEHLLHTIHLFGVPGGAEGSLSALQWDPENHSGWQTSELYSAMKEAVDNGVFSLKDYGDENIDSPETFRIATKEYLYVLNFGMWEFGQEFWENGTLAPEWNDNARTPEGVLSLNPLGYALFNSYIKPVLSRPSLSALRSIFKDNDSGVSGYQPD